MGRQLLGAFFFLAKDKNPILLPLPLLTFLWIAINRARFEYSITNERVIACKGILGRHTAEIENEHIVTMNINQSFPQRLLKIGDIEFTAASGR